jgi:hypothetical protein
MRHKRQLDKLGLADADHPCPSRFDGGSNAVPSLALPTQSHHLRYPLSGKPLGLDFRGSSDFWVAWSQPITSPDEVDTIGWTTF